MIKEVISFEDGDLFDMKEFAGRLESFINVERDFVSGGLVIGLNAPFGSGKSTFLRMWHNDIDKRQSDTNRPLVIDLNAWESDYYGDPLFGIISALVHSNDNDSQPTRKKLIESAKAFGWFMLGISGQLTSTFAGINSIEAGEFAESKINEQKKTPYHPDSFTLYEQRKVAMKSLQDAICQFVSDSGRVVLFLVDELDRCRPDYAITYLETIKHIFDVPGAAFILAADRHQLRNSAMMAFGSELKFDEYYRKFVHREVRLPELTSTEYKKIVNNYIGHYLEIENKRNCFFKLDEARKNDIVETILGLKLTPRQIQEVFRLIGHVMETSERKKGTILWALGIGNVLMAALKVGDPDVYERLGTTGLQPDDALTYIKKLIGDNYSEWWFTLIFTGGGIIKNEESSSGKIYLELGLINNEQGFDMRQDISEFRHAWGYSHKNRFQEIYSKLETISKWS